MINVFKIAGSKVYLYGQWLIGKDTEIEEVT